MSYNIVVSCVDVKGTAAIARLAVSMALHADPADRLIAATAAYLGARLVTKDRRLRASAKVKCLW
ncbi:MAG: PIN domain-containing protein [Kiritimatiellae bacterium]|nr:PIN domain-containing protein [Kiritimatiellia bacterium]